MEPIVSGSEPVGNLDGNLVTPDTGAGVGNGGTPAVIDFTSVEADSIPTELISAHKDFKNLQSTYDRKLDALRGELSAARNAQVTGINQAQLDYAAQVQTALGDKFDPVAQQTLNNLSMQQQIERFEAEKTQYAEQRARDEYISKLTTQYNVDPSMLADVNDPMSAYETVAQQQQTQLADALKVIEQLTGKLGNQSNAASHSPDLGGGAAPTGASAVQADYDAAMKAGDMRLADNISRHANNNDIKLDRFAYFRQSSVA